MPCVELMSLGVAPYVPVPSSLTQRLSPLSQLWLRQTAALSRQTAPALLPQQDGGCLTLTTGAPGMGVFGGAHAGLSQKPVHTLTYMRTCGHVCAFMI